MANILIVQVRKTSCAIFLHFSGERGIINSILPNGIYNLSSISILGTHSHSRHSDSGSPVTKKWAKKEARIDWRNGSTASLVNKFYSHAFITLPNLPSVSLAIFFTCTPLSTSAKGNGTHGRIGMRLTSCLDSSGSLSNRYLTGRITSGSLSSLAGLQCMESWSEN